MLATVNLQNPTLWAVVLGWVMCTVLHELAHGVVGYLGGDYTIRERGGLTLNPFRYMDPLMSIALPIFFLLYGGIPLPGGVTYIRTDLLRNRLWASAVSLAGPLTNALIFVLLALLLHPRFGLVHPSILIEQWTQTQLFLATLLVLQFVVCVINMIPLPPLDGFGAIKPYFNQPTREFFSTRQANTGGMILLFIVVMKCRWVMQGIYQIQDRTLSLMGFDIYTVDLIGKAFNKVIFNQ